MELFFNKFQIKISYQQQNKDEISFWDILDSNNIEGLYFDIKNKNNITII
jgi:hypothetical protein